MTESLLEAILEIIQEDVGQRGLQTDPAENLVSATRGDFQAACHSLAATANPRVCIVTGFLIAHAQPPRPETDGPLGALFLARVFCELGIDTVIASEPNCQEALTLGLEACGLADRARLVNLVPVDSEAQTDPLGYRERFLKEAGRLTHLIALERVGPSHTLESIAAQPGLSRAARNSFEAEVSPSLRGRCYSMRGRDITAGTRPAHLLFEPVGPLPYHTIGIGDGGNEIGMGKIRWDIIRANITNGGLVACRIPTDELIVTGISNWGAYGLGIGTALVRGTRIDADWFNTERERALLEVLVDKGGLVDGVSGESVLKVDGLSFDRFVEPLKRIGAIVR